MDTITRESLLEAFAQADEFAAQYRARYAADSDEVRAAAYTFVRAWLGIDTEEESR